MYRFAPTRLRGKMLSALYMFQPLGQLAASAVTIGVLAAQRNGPLSENTATTCTGECARTLDSTWRWIMGVGMIPAFIACHFVSPYQNPSGIFEMWIQVATAQLLMPSVPMIFETSCRQLNHRVG
jgi:hypothetical protein